MEYRTDLMTHDFSPTGLKFEGAYENDRNACYADLYKDIVREAFGVKDVIVGHHIVYETAWTDGKFDIQQVQEIPSADALIFDHDVARKIWGVTYKDKLARLALEPVSHRDELLAELYYNRERKKALAAQQNETLAKNVWAV